MDARSEETMQAIDPALRALVEAGAAITEPQGVFLCVYQGLRTAAYQNSLYSQGRDIAGTIVTNAKAGHSMHNYGLAVDVVPYMHGQGGPLNWQVNTPDFKIMVDALKSVGLVYGGDWVHFPDNDHFQLAGVPPSPSAAMIADYSGEASLPAIWANVAAGKYA